MVLRMVSSSEILIINTYQKSEEISEIRNLLAYYLLNPSKVNVTKVNLQVNQKLIIS
jgi:hypothetical protein